MRFVRALGAAAVLMLLMLGIPLGLVYTVGNPLASWDSLLAGDVSTSVIIDVLGAVAYVAWAQFAVAVIIELFSALFRVAGPRRFPLVFGGQRRLARSLVLALFMMLPTVVSVAGPAMAYATTAAATPSIQSQSQTIAAPQRAGTDLVLDAAGPRTWWDLAAKHLGAGDRWPEVWALNEGRTQPDGTMLDAPGMLQAGWTITVPTDAAPSDSEVVVTVEPGENLSEIADRFGLDTGTVWQANAGSAQPDGQTFTNPDLIYPNWSITIPAGPETESAAVAADPTTVTVRQGDTLSALAQDYLGDSAQYPALAEANGITDPNMIEVGQVLTLPGPAPVSTNSDLPPTEVPAAAGEDTAPMAASDPSISEGTPPPGDAAASPAGTGSDLEAEADGAAEGGNNTQESTTESPPPAPTSPASVPPTAVTHTESPSEAAPTSATDPAPSGSANVSANVSATTVLALSTSGAALLAGSAWAALARGRRRQFRHRNPGRTVATTPPALVGVERALVTAGKSGHVSVAFLNDALRSLVLEVSRAGLALPDVQAVRLSATELTLLLAHPSVRAPSTWVVGDRGMQWKLLRSDLPDLTTADRELHVAPYPALVSVGYDHRGEHWLLDLEKVATLRISGPEARCQDLARFMAAELAHNVWSEMLQITLVGLGQELAHLNPRRVAVTDDLSKVLTLIRAQRARVSEAESGPLGARLDDVSVDAWAPHVLLVDPSHASTGGETDALEALLSELRAEQHRSTIAVVVAPSETATSVGGWDLVLDEVGMLRIPQLGIELTAQRLPAAEAADLTNLLQMVSKVQDQPAGRSNGENAWDTHADVLGALLPAVGIEHTRDLAVSLTDEPAIAESILPLPLASYAANTAATQQDIESLAPMVTPQARRRVESSDTRLDEDIRAWFDDESPVPKVTLLGPVDVRAQGVLPVDRPRKAWNVEVVAYLATRAHGATDEQYARDLWPGEEIFNSDGKLKPKVRASISTVRSWLGVNARTGREHLPSNPGVKGAIYRLEDVLVDADLFRRLRMRGAVRGEDGIEDLRRALQLVSGVPFDQTRPLGYGWLAESPLDHEYAAMIADVAHIVATHYLTDSKPLLAADASQTALQAGIYDDTIRLDLMAACYAMDDPKGAAFQLRQLKSTHGVDDEVELPKRTFAVLLDRGWLPRSG